MRPKKLLASLSLFANRVTAAGLLAVFVLHRMALPDLGIAVALVVALAAGARYEMACRRSRRFHEQLAALQAETAELERCNDELRRLKTVADLETTFLGAKVIGADHLGSHVLMSLDVSHADVFLDWELDGELRRTTIKAGDNHPVSMLSIPVRASAEAVMAVDDLIGSTVTVFARLAGGEVVELEVQGDPGTPRIALLHRGTAEGTGSTLE